MRASGKPGDFRVQEHITEAIPLNTPAVQDCACLLYHADRINGSCSLRVLVAMLSIASHCVLIGTST